jgi:hypothetical protein
MVAWAVYAEGDVRVTRGEPKWRASSENGMRSFCPACGTGLFYRSEKFLPGLIDIQSATLDDPDRMPAPSVHVQVAERIGWVKDLHLAPTFERYPGQ